jgi:hypothetical protein
LIPLIGEEGLNSVAKQAISVKVGTHRESRSQKPNRVKPISSYGLDNGLHHTDERKGCLLLDLLKRDVKGVTGQDGKVGPRPVQMIQTLDSLSGHFVPLPCFKEIDESLEANTEYDHLRKIIVMKPFVINPDDVLVVRDGRFWAHAPKDPDSLHPSILSCFAPH